eukprot:UN03179
MKLALLVLLIAVAFAQSDEDAPTCTTAQEGVADACTGTSETACNAADTCSWNDPACHYEYRDGDTIYYTDINCMPKQYCTQTITFSTDSGSSTEQYGVTYQEDGSCAAGASELTVLFAFLVFGLWNL